LNHHIYPFLVWQVVIAKVDATEERDLAARFDVSGYPTLKFFGHGDNKEAQPYDGAREVKDFVEFLNDKAGTHRTLDGGLKALAGRVPSLDAILEEFKGKDITAATLDKVKSATASLEGKLKGYGDLYVKAVEKVLAKGKNYVDDEIKRLTKLADGTNVSADKKTLFLLRKNILNAFKGSDGVTAEL